MRAILLSVCALLFAVPLAAADDENTFNCHSWELFVGEREQGVGVSTDDGAVYVAETRTVPGGVYVVSDTIPVAGGSLFSVWVYNENNGRPGLQRADSVCDDTNGGEIEQDCLVSCTF